VDIIFLLEGDAEEEAGALREAQAAGARDEDERLADDAHLQVQRRHHLLPAAVQRPHAQRVLSIGRSNANKGRFLSYWKRREFDGPEIGRRPEQCKQS